jgi:transposase-like protein
MRGRKAPGPEFVQRLEGGIEAKQRLQVILATMQGGLSVKAAAAQLGITPQRFHSLRQEALQAGVLALEPGAPGRPRRTATPEQERLEELAQENERLQRELEASRLRAEIAVLLPGRAGPEKKRRSAAADPEGTGRR